jgi:hypothetical protein
VGTAAEGLDLLVIDYLQLLQGSTRLSSENRVQEITEITTKLKALAKELRIPVLALSQLSRQVESRDDKRPWRSAPGSRLQRTSRSKQPDQREPDQSADLDHRVEASPDSLPCASRIRLTTGIGKFGSDKTSMGDVTT